MNPTEQAKNTHKKAKQLNKENYEMFSKVMVYIRTNLNKNDKQSEEVINDMLDHLIEAEANGVTTKEFFGDDPKAFAEELVNELPNETPKEKYTFAAIITLELIGIFLVIEGIFDIIYHFTETSLEPIYIVQYIIRMIVNIIVLFIIIRIAFKYIRNSEFKLSNTRFIPLILLVLAIMAYSFSQAFLINLITIGPTVVLPWFLRFTVGLICVCVFLIFFKKKY